MAAPHSEDISGKVQKWVNESKTLRIFVVGKLGVGKSTLINSLLNKQVAEVGSGLEAVTTKVTKYSRVCKVPYKKVTLHGIDVTLWDTPGLQDPLVDKESLLEDIRSNISDNVDLYVYCVQMTQTRAEQGDYDAIADLTGSLGTDFWKRSLFALTFANDVCVPLSADGTSLEEYFQGRVDGWTKLLRNAVLEAGVDKKDVDRIPVIPTGFNKERIPALASSSTPWFTTFWSTCLGRVRFLSIPALLAVNQEEWNTEMGSDIAVNLLIDRLLQLGHKLDRQLESEFQVALKEVLVRITPQDLWRNLKLAVLRRTSQSQTRTHYSSSKALIALAAATAAIIAIVFVYRQNK